MDHFENATEDGEEIIWSGQPELGMISKETADPLPTSNYRWSVIEQSRYFLTKDQLIEINSEFKFRTCIALARVAYLHIRKNGDVYDVHVGTDEYDDQQRIDLIAIRDGPKIDKIIRRAMRQNSGGSE
tara:strand:+ start:4112 stop:4495 length:384 start_codon:yes stop_codon:yes gene_type:complete